jgi:hypothetical protein
MQHGALPFVFESWHLFCLLVVPVDIETFHVVSVAVSRGSAEFTVSVCSFVCLCPKTFCIYHPVWALCHFCAWLPCTLRL